MERFVWNGKTQTCLLSFINSSRNTSAKYRPARLTFVICKVLEHLLKNHRVDIFFVKRLYSNRNIPSGHLRHYVMLRFFSKTLLSLWIKVVGPAKRKIFKLKLCTTSFFSLFCCIDLLRKLIRRWSGNQIMELCRWHDILDKQQLKYYIDKVINLFEK